MIPHFLKIVSFARLVSLLRGLTHHRSQQRLVKPVDHGICATIPHKPCCVPDFNFREKTRVGRVRSTLCLAKGRTRNKEWKKKKRTKRKGKIAIKNRREKKGSGKKKVYGNSIIPKIVFQQAFVSRADMNQLWISSEGKISSIPEPQWIKIGLMSLIVRDGTALKNVSV